MFAVTRMMILYFFQKEWAGGMQKCWLRPVNVVLGGSWLVARRACGTRKYFSISMELARFFLYLVVLGYASLIFGTKISP